MTKREIIIDGAVAYIPLTRGYTATIDACDVPLASGSWFAAVSSKSFVYAAKYDSATYALVRDRARSAIKLHRLLMGNPSDLFVDHINGDTLDNRRSNLRIVTHAENAKNRALSRNNRSGVPGVSWDTSKDSWRAELSVNGRRVRLGTFKSLEDAKVVRERAAAAVYGEFARSA